MKVPAWTAALLVTLLLPASAAAEVPRGWFGMAADGPLLEEPAGRDHEWTRIRKSGVGFVRVSFPWRIVEQDPGVRDFARTDAIVRRATRHRLAVLPEVHGTPPWAAVHPRRTGSRPRDPEHFAAILRAFVRRYGPSGTFWEAHPGLPARPIRRWQIWNEPNLKAYWSEQPFAARYVDLLRASRRVLDEEDPGAELILGGMPNRSWEALASIYEAGGRGLFDAVALHPYTSSVANVMLVLRLVRQEMVFQGDGEVPLWLTELSWPASARRNGLSPDGFETTARRQAKRLRRGYQQLARERESLRIAGVVWYTWLSREGYSRPSWAAYTGLRRIRDGRVVNSPAFTAFRSTVARLQRR